MFFVSLFVVSALFLLWSEDEECKDNVRRNEKYWDKIVEDYKKSETTDSLEEFWKKSYRRAQMQLGLFVLLFWVLTVAFLLK